MKTEIIYSIRVMKQLVSKGHIPIAMMPNPQNSKYNCWVFEVNEAFLRDRDQVLKEVSAK